MGKYLFTVSAHFCFKEFILSQRVQRMEDIQKSSWRGAEFSFNLFVEQNNRSLNSW